MPTVVTRLLAFLLVLVSCLCAGNEAVAHHVLGRPAYALNENSNTPPSMQLETVIGDYFVNYMVFPPSLAKTKPWR